MVSVFKLVKILLKEQFLGKKKIKRNNKKFNIGFVLILVLIIFYGYIFTNNFYLTFTAQKSLFPDNYNKILYNIVGITNMASLFFILLSGNSLMLTKTDETILGTIPIDEKKIVIAKLIVALFIDTFFDILIGLCGAIAYIILGDITLTGLFVVLFCPVLSGILPLCLLSFVIILSKRAIQKSKYKKAFEIIGMLLTVLLIIFISMMFTMSTSSYENDSMLMISNVYSNILTYYPLLILIKMALDFNNLIYFILYLVSLIVICYVFIKLFTKYAFRLMLEPKNNYIGKKEKIEFNKKDINKVLLKKEFKVLTSSNILIINTVTMPVLFLIMYILFSFVTPVDLIEINNLLNTNLNISEIAGAFFLINGIASCMFPSFTLSLESKSTWILLTIPVDSSLILKIKRYSNYIIQGIYSLLIFIIYLISQFDILYAVGFIVIGIGSSIFSTNIFQLINLKHHSTGLDAAILVKQSKESMISSFVIMGFIFIVPCLAVISFMFIKSIGLALLMIGLLLITMGMFINKKINKTGMKLLKEFC